MKKNNAWLGYLLIFMAGAMWGTGGLYVTQMISLGASTFMTGFVNHFFALFPLLAVILFSEGREGLKISKRGLLFAIIMGIVTKGFFKMAYDSAVSIVGVSTGAVLLYTAPVFVAIMSTIFFKEKLRINNYVALGLNLIGVFLMVSLGNLSSLNIAPLGVTMGLTAAFLHASNTIMAKLATTDDDPLTTTFYMLLASSITQGLVAQPWSPNNLDLLMNGEFLMWALLSAVVTGAIANLCYLKGMSTIVDASKAPVISSVEVIVATLMGVFIFSEPMNRIGIFGGLLMISSIVLMNMNPEGKKIKALEAQDEMQKNKIQPAKIKSKGLKPDSVESFT